ncbi:hypothetical protein OSTOST_23567, partial [Ostertagia ostertagi]
MRLYIPPTATLMFEVRRIDDKSEIVYSGSEPNCRLEGLSSRQHVEVPVERCAKLILSFWGRMCTNGSRYEGDWSPVTGGNAPRDAPSTPTELAINSESQVMSGHETEETVSETGECHYSLALLDHAKQFTCRVSAFHDGGESPLSQPLVFTTRSGAPAQPD